MNPSPIFIHSLFRTGSTYLWNKFRQHGRFRCYYEPLHPELAGLNSKKPDALEFDRKTLQKMRHPSLDKRFFAEYMDLLEPSSKGVPFFKKTFSFDEFCHTGDNPDLRKYIDFILQYSKKKMPVLQFNRSAFRIYWFKKTYPASSNIYTFRSPRDQWQSYLETGEKFDKVFVTMDLLITSNNKHSDYFKPLSNQIDLIEFHSEKTGQELLVYQYLSDAYSLEEKYFIFYYIWFYAFVENVLHADLILNMNRLSTDSTYRNQITEIIRKTSGHTIDFSDAGIRTYDRFPIPPGRMQAIEAYVQSLVLTNLDKSVVTEHFFPNIPEKDKAFFNMDREWLDEALNYHHDDGCHINTIPDKHDALFRLVKKQDENIKEILGSRTFRAGRLLMAPLQYVRTLMEKINN